MTTVYVDAPRIMTLQQKIQVATNHPSGFDYMRVTLSTLIICFHSIVTSMGLDAQARFNESPYGLSIALVLPMFFSVSGFLVAGSLERSRNVAAYLGLRALRIFPALIVDTLLAVLVIGPLLTTTPVGDYFRSPLVRDYLMNMLGLMHYQLPGVFQANPIDQINGALWTIPYELMCYLCLAAAAALGLYRRRWLIPMFLVVATLAQELRFIQLDTQLVQQSRLLVLCFVAGVTIFVYRDRIPWNRSLFIVSVILTLLTIRVPLLAMFAALPVAYATVFLGVTNPTRKRIVATGDYSYGMFLYGFPVQQILVATVPAAQTWYINILLAVPIAFICSILSWHLVEKRAMRLKRYLDKASNRPSSEVARPAA